MFIHIIDIDRFTLQLNSCMSGYQMVSCYNVLRSV